MDRQERDALFEQINALEAKFAAQAEALRTMRTGAPSAPASLPPLRPERAALWRIAMLCKDALASSALPPEWRPYFVQIARVCREGVTREEGRRGT